MVTNDAARAKSRSERRVYVIEGLAEKYGRGRY
jgi:hypothetical protein